MWYVEFMVIKNFLLLTLGALGGLGVVLTAIRASYRADKLSSNILGKYKELKSLFGDDGLRISKNMQLKKEQDYEGVCMIAPTGAGKTSTLFLNNLLENKIRGSLIVTDPKGEIYELTSGYQQHFCGRKVYKIDFTNIDSSERYNLLANCKDSEEVIRLASDLLMNGSLSIELGSGKKIGGVEWIQMAEPLLAAVLLYVRTLKKPFNTIEFALQLVLNLNNTQIKSLIEKSKNIDALTQYNIFLMVGGADKTEGSIKITLASNMKLFTTKDVNKISIDTTFDIEKFREEESILYVIYPERKSTYLSPFIAPLFSQFINKLLDKYEKDKSLPVHFLFDEFGNIGMISDMKTNVATIRSREISFTICLQGITQLQQIYGIDNSKTILNNLKTKIVLSGLSDIDTLNYISNLCGTKEITVKSVTTNGEKRTETYSKATKKIFADGELRTINSSIGVFIVSNKMPVVDEIVPYYESKIKDNVYPPVAFKNKACFSYSLNREIERFKERAINKEEELDYDNARRTLRQIFTQEG